MITSSGAPEAGVRTSVYLGIGLCSVGVLMQEILLTRIFSFTIWYHLAYLTISTALLGFGAAGSLLTVFPQWIQHRPARFAGICSAGAGFALVLSLTILGPRPISPDEMIENPAVFFLELFGYYAVITVPFLLAGLAVATPLAAFPTQANRLYAADLLGAGLGCIAAVTALSLIDGPAAIFICAALFVAAGACYAMPDRLAAGLLATAAGLALLAPLASSVLEFKPTLTKSLGEAVERRNAQVHYTEWSPVNRVDLYGTPGARGGFWTAYGRSRGYRSIPPQAMSIVYDGHNGSDVYKIEGRHSLDVLDYHILSTPYLFYEKPRVLVIGVGGGIDVLNALYHGAEKVTGVELQPITVKLHNGMLAEWTGGWFQRPEVELVAAEGRHYVRSHDDRYDILQITAVDTFSAQTTGAYVLAESYLYTVEAFEDYLSKLSDDGMLSIVIGDLLYNDPAIPTPFSTRLVLVAREALERRGVEDPKAHILLTGQGIPNFNAPPEQIVAGAWIQSLIVKKTPFTPEQLETLRAFQEPNGFEVRLSPTDTPGDPNLERIVNAPAESLQEVLDEQIFSLEPITDNRPFFFNVLPWREIVVDRRIEWSNPGSGTGQIVLLMMLGQSLILGAVLIGVPLLRGARGALPRRTTAGFLVYFLALGLGFLLIEISFVQKYVLLLGYPTYSLSVTIFSLLVFAALGAALSRRGWKHPERSLIRMLAVTLVLLTLEVLILPWLRERLLASSLATRIALTVAMQLPLGIVLGMYFPTGLELLRRREPRLIPWAWAVNGVASVAASVIAVLLGMAIGFSGVAFVAGAIYALGTVGLLSALRAEARGEARTA
jgi:hypothetical protein